MSSDGSVLKRRHEDCLSCRLISGFGVVGMGAYIYSHSKNKPSGPMRHTMVLLSGAVALVGAARLANVFPFPLDKKT